MRRLVMVRHGETDFNAQGRLQGQSNTPLNATGMKQVERVAQVLRGESLDATWTSPLERALETARCINRHHDHALDIRESLKERSFGVLECQDFTQVAQAKAAHNGHPWDFSPEGGESLRELEIRAASVVDNLKTCPHETLLIVGHGGIFRAIIGVLLQWDIDRWKDQPQHNTCINTFQFDPDGHVVAYQLNDHAHCW